MNIDFFPNILKTVKEKSGSKPWMIPFVITCAWTVDAFLSIIINGFAHADIWLFFSMIFKVSIIACNGYFIRVLFIGCERKLYGVYKTYAGYCAILVYVIYALPRISREMGGNISGEYFTFLWALNLLSASFPAALYLLFQRPKTQTAWGIITLEEYSTRKSEKRPSPFRLKGPVGFLLENVNILIQAILIVILIQHFVFQPYIIPSESMVPTFLKQDRPFVTKLVSGPMIPFSNIKLPSIVSPQRGMVVVFENPSYVQTDLAKKIFHHLVFLATFSLVNIDSPYHFIVKRVIAGPGEKIMMVDDTVYIKKRGDAEFSRLAIDAMEYSHVNLYSENEKTRKNIGLPIVKEDRLLFDKWDEIKNNADLILLHGDAVKLKDEIRSGITTTESRFIARAVARVGESPLARMGWFGANGFRVYEKYIASRAPLYAKPSRSDNQYIAGGKKLNLLCHIAVLKRLKTILRLYRLGMNEEAIASHPDFFAAESELDELERYVVSRPGYDERNFPEYPGGADNYFQDGEYFLMGDNRYNSRDFRYGEESERKLDPGDEYSFTYKSALALHTLDEKRILGIALFRMWPPERIGLVK